MNLLTIPETCERLRCSRMTLHRLTHEQRELTPIKQGRAVRYVADDVDAYIRRQLERARERAQERQERAQEMAAAIDRGEPLTREKRDAA